MGEKGEGVARNHGLFVATRLPHESLMHPWRGTGQQREWDDGVEQQKLEGIWQFERQSSWQESSEKDVGRNRHQ
jgi:hypothetical protein